jgi:hypothetical protein
MPYFSHSSQAMMPLHSLLLLLETDFARTIDEMFQDGIPSHTLIHETFGEKISHCSEIISTSSMVNFINEVKTLDSLNLPETTIIPLKNYSDVYIYSAIMEYKKSKSNEELIYNKIKANFYTQYGFLSEQDKYLPSYNTLKSLGLKFKQHNSGEELYEIERICVGKIFIKKDNISKIKSYVLKQDSDFSYIKDREVLQFTLMKGCDVNPPYDKYYAILAHVVKGQ